MSESPKPEGTLSFFQLGSDDDLSDSDCSDKEEDHDAEKSDLPHQRGPSTLPPPLHALADAKTPDFVTSHLSSDLKWDKMVKQAPYVPPKELKPWEVSLPAVESVSTIKDDKPDITLVKQIPSSTARPAEPKPKPVPQKTVDHAILWSKMYKDQVDSGKALKRPRGEDVDEDLKGFCHTDLEEKKVAFSKNGQPVSYRDKEKRKRKLGQSNRDKMYVEDEKRVLRQEFASNF